MIQFLKLDDPKFVEERRLYIKNRRKSIERNGDNPADYFQNLMKEEPERVKHIRAIEEEFNIKIDFGIIKSS